MVIDDVSLVACGVSITHDLSLLVHACLISSLWRLLETLAPKLLTSSRLSMISCKVVTAGIAKRVLVDDPHLSPGAGSRQSGSLPNVVGFSYRRVEVAKPARNRSSGNGHLFPRFRELLHRHP